MSAIKNIFIHYWKKDMYTMSQIRSVTREAATSKKFNYNEFYENTGVTVEEYDANMDKFKDMVCSDLINQRYLTTEYLTA